MQRTLNPKRIYKLLHDPLNFLLRNARDTEDICRIGLGGLSVIHIHHPDLIRKVLISNDKYFQKSKDNKHLRFLLGDGLQTSDGEEWRHQRKQLQPAFSKEQLRTYYAKINDSILDVIEKWASNSHSNVVCIQEEMKKIALKSVNQALYNHSCGDDFSQFQRALNVIIPILAKKATNPFSLPYKIPLWSHVKLKRERKVLYKKANEIINERLSSAEEPNDLLKYILGSKKVNQSRKPLIDQVMTFLLAGQATTANSLTFSLYLLATNVELQHELREEVLSNELANPEEIYELPLLSSFVKESLRLYPPSWVISRESTKMLNIGDYTIHKGDTILISPYVMHRHPVWWDEPSQFQAKRFLEEKSKGSQYPRGAFLPFGLGPRSCIGEKFAMHEMLMTLAMILSRYNFTIIDGENWMLKPSVNLTPSQNLFIKVSKN